MVLAIKSGPLPLRQEPNGTVRVGHTRVLLDVDAYLAAREKHADRLRAHIESHIDTRGLRDRLLARRQAKQQGRQP